MSNRKMSDRDGEDRAGEAAGEAAGQEAEGTAANAQQEEGSVEEKIAALEAENQQLRDRALRSVAELENVRRRSQQERQQTVEYANEQLLRQLLPILDDFERSLQAGASAHDFDSFFKGVELIFGNIQKLLERLGVRRMETVGKPFDVHLHEALLRQPSDQPEDAVVADVEPGYTYHDRVLRHAKVIVSAGS